VLLRLGNRPIELLRGLQLLLGICRRALPVLGKRIFTGRRCRLSHLLKFRRGLLSRRQLLARGRVLELLLVPSAASRLVHRVVTRKTIVGLLISFMDRSCRGLIIYQVDGGNRIVATFAELLEDCAIL